MRARHLVLWRVMVKVPSRSHAERRLAECFADLTLDGSPSRPEPYVAMDGWWEGSARREIDLDPHRLTAEVMFDAARLGSGWVVNGPSFFPDGTIDRFDGTFDPRQFGRPEIPELAWAIFEVSPIEEDDP